MSLTPSQQRRYDRAAEALDESRRLDVREVSPTALSHHLGALEVSLQQVLRLVDELTGAV